MIIFGVETIFHTFTRESVEQYIEQAYKAGQEDERAKIVAWGRLIWLAQEWGEDYPVVRLLNWVEAGEHLK